MKRVLIELPTWLGDAVMASPSIENLVKSYSNINIVFIGSISSIEVYKNHPNRSFSLVIERNLFRLFKQVGELGKFDIFITFRNSFRSTFIKFLIDAENKYQYKKKNYSSIHQVEKYSEFINRVTSKNFPPGRLIIHGQNKIKDNKKLTIGINPGASYGDAKRWETYKFAEVIEEISKIYNSEVLIFGGKNELYISNEIENLLKKKNISNFRNLIGQTSLGQLIQTIKNLDILVTNDSGPMHIAAAFKIPTISIFGPTDMNATSQWKGNGINISLDKPLACQPCLQRTCPLGHRDCMKKISSKRVIKALEMLIIRIKKANV